jgi:hypothetical protein
MYGISRCRLVSAPLNNISATVSSLKLYSGSSCYDDKTDGWYNIMETP